MGRAVLRLFMFLAASLTVFPAHAQPKFCSLALVLAIDSSSSVDQNEYQLQMTGTAAAILDPEVIQAIETIGGVYLAAFEWNGKRKQKLIFDWIFVTSQQEALEISRIFGRHQRDFENEPTAIGAALQYSYGLFQRLPVTCSRKVIDIAGDGHSNDGITPKQVYAGMDFSEILVNGLVIKSRFENPESFYRDPELYYRENVLHGPGAFLEIAYTFENFENAMRKKLLKEITPGPIGMIAK